MTVIVPTPEITEKITRQSLREVFPLYEERQVVDGICYKGKLLIGYRARECEDFDTVRETHFDLNLVEKICYLLSLGLEERYRGMGLGYKLIQSVIDTAENLGCKRVRTQPSGNLVNVNTGEKIETVRDYLLKRKWVPAPERQLDFIIS